MQHPLFLANIPGWFEDVPDDMTFEDDRAYLEGVIDRLDVASGNPRKIGQMLRESYERQFLQMSLHNRSVNSQYSQRDIRRYYGETDRLQELESFLVCNNDLRAYDCVQRLQGNGP